MRILLLILILQFNLCFAQDAALTEHRKLQNNDPVSFADVVEPLIATVVNIYTEQSAARSKRSMPYHFKEFKDLFEEFAIPFPFDDVYNNPKAVSLGSGFIVAKDGYIVTNNHVVENADKINVKLYDGSEFEAVLVGGDKKTDIALLKIAAKHDLPVAVFGNDAKSRIGDWVITIGNPFGFSHTVTKGIISSKARDIDFDRYGIISNYIQTDAPINKGNSGGPMFNMQGQVIGVNTYIYSNSGNNIGIGFAIPAQIVEKVVHQLKVFGKVRRGLLNIEIQELTAEICEGLGISEQKGVLITSVYSNGVGAKAGLKAGDIIIGINQQEIHSTKQLQQMISSIEIDSNFKIKIMRGRQTSELSAVMSQEASTDTASISSNKKALSAGEIEINQVVFANMSDALLDKYSIDSKLQGVVVTHVEKSSSWRDFVKVGDVVVNVNQQDVKNVKDVERFYKNSATNRKNIIFMIKRHNSSVFLALPITK